MKKIIFIIFISVLVLLIYLGLKDKKVYYFSIIDYNSKYSFNNYINDYLDEKNIKEDYINYNVQNYRVKDIIDIIRSNDYIDNRKVKNILIKADLITISISLKEVFNSNDIDYYDNVNKYLNDVEELLRLLRYNCKEEIIFIGYFNLYKDIKYDYYINFLNKMVECLCDKYNIKFVHRDEMSLYLNEEYPNIEGEHIVFNKLRKIIDNKYV